MFNHPPKPAFPRLNSAIKRRLAELLNDSCADNAWGVAFEAKKLNALYAQLELKQALHAAKGGQNNG